MINVPRKRLKACAKVGETYGKEIPWPGGKYTPHGKRNLEVSLTCVSAWSTLNWPKTNSTEWRLMGALISLGCHKFAPYDVEGFPCRTIGQSRDVACGNGRIHTPSMELHLAFLGWHCSNHLTLWCRDLIYTLTLECRVVTLFSPFREMSNVY